MCKWCAIFVVGCSLMECLEAGLAPSVDVDLEDRNYLVNEDSIVVEGKCPHLALRALRIRCRHFGSNKGKVTECPHPPNRGPCS